MIEVLSPGIQASVQDCGRPGLRNQGVGSVGAMDARALRIGNLMIGNTPDLAGIEFTMGGFRLRFQSDIIFALTGAATKATLDGQPVPAWWVRRARAGQVLAGGMAENGMRSYLTLAGGIDVPELMGSRSTDLKGGFGGAEGRALQAGDCLPAGSGEVPQVGRTGFGLAAGRLGLLPQPAPTPISFIPAKEWDSYPARLQQQFLDTEWVVQHNSNRMGYQLSGPALLRPTPLELLSHGILPGTIQLPPAGQPVIQMHDANTCGGYPKLGVVIAPDLSVLAQVRLGSTIRFCVIDRVAALKLAVAEEEFLQRLTLRIGLARDYSTRINPEGSRNG